MVVIIFAVQELSEQTFIPEFFRDHVGFHERIVFKQIVDFSAFLHRFDKSDRFRRSVERRHFAHDMLSCVQSFDRVFRMVHKPGRDKHGVHVLRKKFVFIRCQENIRSVFPEIFPDVFVEVAAGDDVDVQSLAACNEVPAPSESPDAEFDALVGVEYFVRHFWPPFGWLENNIKILLQFANIKNGIIFT